MRYFKGLKSYGKDGRPRWAVMNSFDIPCKSTGERGTGTGPELEDGLYLRRLRILHTPFFGLLLHEIHEADQDYDPHDHPWAFLSLVLKGGYVEEVADHPGEKGGMAILRKKHRRFSLHRMRTTQAHQIIGLSARPTWTLLLTGPRVREWGFWTTEGWVNWQEYRKVTTP